MAEKKPMQKSRKKARDIYRVTIFRQIHVAADSKTAAEQYARRVIWRSDGEEPDWAVRGDQIAPLHGVADSCP
jgi:hypothetical protein